MIAKELISDTIVPLQISENGETALNRMNEFNVTHLPVLDDNTLIGLIADTDVFNRNDFSLLLGQYIFSLGLVYVTQYQHIYDVIKLFDTHQLTLLPVLDDKRHYLGSITLPKLISHFSILSAAKSTGAIIILEINTSDYLMTQIAQIIESNEAKILSLCTTTYSDSTRMEITLKINKVEIRSILQTFNRYNYIVKASFTEEDVYEDLRERYDSFMRYLNT